MKKNACVLSFPLIIGWMLLFSNALFAQSIVKDFIAGPGGSGVSQLTRLTNGLVLFAASDTEHGNELWITDGTCAGTRFIQDIRPGPDGSFPGGFTQVGNLVFFEADDGQLGRELWAYNVLQDTAYLVADIFVGPGSFGIFEMLNFGDSLLIFSPYEDATGREPWRSDGTPAGTYLLKNLQAGSASSGPGFFTQYNGYVYFGAFDSSHGPSLWRTNGSTAGTTFVHDFVSGAGGSVGPMFDFKGKLLIVASNVTNGRELWTSTGEPGTVSLLKDIHPGTGNGVSDDEYVVAGNYLYFGGGDANTGSELWRTDGTPDGTIPVADIFPGASSSAVDGLVARDSLIFFEANDGVHGQELWRHSIPTFETTLVADISPGLSDAFPANMIFAGDSLYFTANDGVHGFELWNCALYPPAVRLVADMRVGPENSSYISLLEYNDTLLFTAWSTQWGSELFRYPPAAVVGAVLSVQLTDLRHVSCKWEQDGRIEVSVLQGACPYSYQWSNGGQQEYIDHLSGGVYSCTITAADGQQVVLDSLVVTEPTQLIALVLDAEAPDCLGNTGYAQVGAEGGTPPYSFLWDNGVTGPSLIDIPAPGGYYIFTVTDANGCTTFNNAYAAAEVPSYPYYLDVPPTVCPGGIATIGELIPTRTETADIQQQGYTYYWTAVAGGAIAGNPDTPFTQIQGAGLYVLQTTVIASGCTRLDSFWVALDTTPPAVYAGEDFTVPCSQTPTQLQGAVESEDDFGEPVFQWLAYNGGAITGDINSLNTEASGAGLYVLTYSNSLSGCTDADTVVVVAQNMSPEVISSGGNITCLTDTVTLSVIFSVPNLVFDGWYGPEGLVGLNQTVLVTDPGNYTAKLTDTVSGCSTQVLETVLEDTYSPEIFYLDAGLLYCPDQQPVTIYPGVFPSGVVYSWSGPGDFSSSLEFPTVNEPGDYFVTVTNPANGCTDSSAVTVNAGAALEIFIDDIQPADCAGAATGAASLGASGGAGIYFWKWPDGTTGPTNTALAQGAYLVTLTDVSGCTETIEINIDAPSPLLPGIQSLTPVDCAGASTGAATIEVSGGTAPYSWLWPDGTTEPTNEGLAAGEYAVTLTDANGCTGEVVIQIDAPSPLLLANVVVVDDQNSQGIGAIYAHIEGGTPPYEYGWTLNGQPIPGTADSLTQLFTGNYTLVVMDGNGCAFSPPSIFVNNLIATAEPVWAAGMILAPNPTDDQVQIRFAAPLPASPLVRVFDETGRVVSVALLREEATVIWLDTSALSPGMYQVQVVVGRERALRKLVVVR